MALGTPIVAHNNPGYEWVMQGTGRLSLVDVKDASEFARRLQLIIEDDALRKVWMNWAEQYVKQFSYENIATDYEKLYNAVLVDV
jgi:glycosyltransferase involved in cell wall biosynthesis